ncbi:MAG: transglutaminase domain-containing protein [Deltaproteobacteria bacterium]|nr:transglutaminase domain-containing protein [Deltaproteobacteria bacterium]
METFAENDIGICLQPTFNIDSDNGKLIGTAESLTRECSGDAEKAVKLFYFVRDSIRYNLFMISVFKEDFKASRILEWGKGYCVQKAVLLAALGRAAGIPSRLAFAKITNHRVPLHILEKLKTNTYPRHGYNQFYLNGRWVNVTATFDRELCRKNALPVVEFDGKHDAVLPGKDLEGNPYIEYVRKFPPTEDLPFDWIVEKISKIVGPDKRPFFKKPDSSSN